MEDAKELSSVPRPYGAPEQNDRQTSHNLPSPHIDSFKTPNLDAALNNMIPTSSDTTPTKSWTILGKWLPTHSDAEKYWWNLTGPHLAALFENANYPMEKQFEALMIHYSQIVGSLGPTPNPNSAIHMSYKAILTADGTPIEYSWKWNTASNTPEVRYCIEAIGPATGTAQDPLNQIPSLQLLYCLKEKLEVPKLDLVLFHHFRNALYDHGQELAFMRQIEAGSFFHGTNMNALEFSRKGLFTKTYFIPRKIGITAKYPFSKWESAIRLLESNNPSLDTVRDFMCSNPEGKTLSPMMAAIDNIPSRDSRIKLYFQTSRTSFACIKTIITLNGCITLSDEKLADIRAFVAKITGFPDDFSDDTEMPGGIGNVSPINKGVTYYFDIAPYSSNPIPDVKLFVPVQRFGRNDLSIATGLCEWMTDRGRGQFCDGYMAALKAIAKDGDLSKSHGVQSFASIMVKKNGDLDVTSYLNPVVYSNPVAM